MLLDRGANLSFVTPFLDIKFCMSPEILREPFLVYTLVGESVVSCRVYRAYLALVLHKVIPCDLVVIEMVYFDVILGINWLYPSYAFIDCKI